MSRVSKRRRLSPSSTLVRSKGNGTQVSKSYRSNLRGYLKTPGVELVEVWERIEDPKASAERGDKSLTVVPPQSESMVMEEPTPDEVRMLEELYAEFDAIDARIAATQAETQKLKYETRMLLSELESIVSRL